MPKSSRLIDRPTGLFPFNQLAYDRITEKFETIERRFCTLQHSGNEEAKRLGDMAARINCLVWEFWSGSGGSGRSREIVGEKGHLPISRERPIDKTLESEVSLLKEILANS